MSPARKSKSNLSLGRYIEKYIKFEINIIDTGMGISE